MNDDRRREVADAALEALRHTVERDEHMPVLKRLVERREGMEARLEGGAWMGSPPGMEERSAAVGTSLRLAAQTRLVRTPNQRTMAAGASGEANRPTNGSELLGHLVGL